VVRANARRDKAPVLLTLREELEELKVLLRLCLPRYVPWKDGRYSGYSERGMGRPFFAYLLRCADEFYYLGHTADLTRRLQEHQEGGRCADTTPRRPVTLVWSEEFQTREQAKQAEARIKRWSRAKKEALARRDLAGLRLAARKSWTARQRRKLQTEDPE
jgi:predicted GIY-YIG superfamily endonuclease